MRSRCRPGVCMLIHNEIIRDGRVLRAAQALSRHYDLTVLGLDTRKFRFDKRAARRKFGLRFQWVNLGTANWPHKAFRTAVQCLEANMRHIISGIRPRPDVIHAHELSSIPAALAIRRLTGAKIVYDAHELYREDAAYKCLLGRLASRMETRAMQVSAGIIACNHQRAEIMYREYGAPFMPTVVRNIPPYKKYHPSGVLKEYVLQRNPAIKRICIHHGGIWAKRGMDLLVRALEYLPSDVAMVFVGKGKTEYVRDLHRMARELGVADRFFVHPPVDYVRLFDLLCSADVGVAIYRDLDRNNYYCAPNKLYEYSASGLPIAGADLPPIKEYLQTYKNGLLFEQENPHSLSQAISKILKDKQAYTSFKNNGLAAARIMCWENESKILLDLYDRIITGGELR